MLGFITTKGRISVSFPIVGQCWGTSAAENVILKEELSAYDFILETRTANSLSPINSLITLPLLGSINRISLTSDCETTEQVSNFPVVSDSRYNFPPSLSVPSKGTTSYKENLNKESTRHCKDVGKTKTFPFVATSNSASHVMVLTRSFLYVRILAILNWLFLSLIIQPLFLAKSFSSLS